MNRGTGIDRQEMTSWHRPTAFMTWTSICGGEGQVGQLRSWAQHPRTVHPPPGGIEIVSFQTGTRAEQRDVKLGWDCQQAAGSHSATLSWVDTFFFSFLSKEWSRFVDIKHTAWTSKDLWIITINVDQLLKLYLQQTGLYRSCIWQCKKVCSKLKC